MGVEAEYVLDDFSTAQIAASGERTCVSGAGIVGGERDIWAVPTTRIEINSMIAEQLYIVNESASESVSVEIVYDGQDGSTYFSYMNGLGNADFCCGGLYGGFALDVTGAQNKGGSIEIAVFQEEMKGAMYAAAAPVNAQTLYFSFSSFAVYEEGIWEPIDFADVGYLTVTFNLEHGECYAVDSFYLVPEPGTLLLLIAGGVFLRRYRDTV